MKYHHNHQVVPDAAGLKKNKCILHLSNKCIHSEGVLQLFWTFWWSDDQRSHTEFWKRFYHPESSGIVFPELRLKRTSVIPHEGSSNQNNTKEVWDLQFLKNIFAVKIYLTRGRNVCKVLFPLHFCWLPLSLLDHLGFPVTAATVSKRDMTPLVGDKWNTVIC